MESKTNSLLIMRNHVNHTTGTPGWAYVLKFAERILKERQEAFLAEDDEEEALRYRRMWLGARLFWSDLMCRIDLAKTQDIEPAEDPADEFYAILESVNERTANA